MQTVAHNNTRSKDILGEILQQLWSDVLPVISADICDRFCERNIMHFITSSQW